MLHAITSESSTTGLGGTQRLDKKRGQLSNDFPPVESLNQVKKHDVTPRGPSPIVGVRVELHAFHDANHDKVCQGTSG